MDAEVNIKRVHAKVPVEQVQELLAQAVRHTGFSEREIMTTIGYAHWTSASWPADGIPVRTKYAILGFMHDIGLKPSKDDLVLTKDEALDLFLLLGGRGDRVPEKARKNIVDRILQFALV